jgi:hypothetical protein
MSRKFADDVASSYAAGRAGAHALGVINAFTRASQKLGPLQRIEVERFAGTLIEADLWSLLCKASYTLAFFH